MLISTIIPAYNEEKIIAQTLNNINLAIESSKQKGYQWEIIICDNDSTDKTVEIASQFGAKIVREPFKQISTARNTGAKNATGDWLIFIDADTYPTPELIDEVLKGIARETNIGYGTTIVVEGGTLFNKLRMERLNPFFRLFNFCGGAFIACKREGFDGVNGFSTHLYAYEDLDFVFRLKRYGYKKEKKFSVLHKHPVITSGRKGDYNIRSIFVLYTSNFASVIIFILQYFLPNKWVAKMGRSVTGYWYNNR